MVWQCQWFSSFRQINWLIDWLSRGQLGRSVASLQNDLNVQHISADQRAAGGCQSDADTATCFLGHVEDVSKNSQEAV